jgi:hypothetical protein
VKSLSVVVASCRLRYITLYVARGSPKFQIIFNFRTPTFSTVINHSTGVPPLSGPSQAYDALATAHRPHLRFRANF